MSDKLQWSARTPDRPGAYWRWTPNSEGSAIPGVPWRRLHLVEIVEIEGELRMAQIGGPEHAFELEAVLWPNPGTLWCRLPDAPDEPHEDNPRWKLVRQS